MITQGPCILPNDFAPPIDRHPFVLYFRTAPLFLSDLSGLHGVAHPLLIKHFGNVLQQTYNYVLSTFGRPLPKAPILVYIFDIGDLLPGFRGAFSFIGRDDEPIICLPCGTGRSPEESELSYAAAMTCHEVIHLFNWVRRPPNRLTSEPWLWLDEASALLFEGKLRSNGRSNGTCVPYHVTNSHPLDHPRSEEYARLFLSYIEHHGSLGLDRFFEIWDTAPEDSTPAEAFSDNSTRPTHFLPLFHGFARSMYFHSESAFDPHFVSVLETPNIAGSFDFDRHGEQRSPDTILDHLSFHYYECDVAPEFVGLLEVIVHTANPTDTRKLRAEIIGIDAEKSTHIRTAANRFVLLPDAIGDRTELRSGELLLPLGGVDGDSVSHFLIIVSNCGTRSGEKAPDGRHDDDVVYQITVSVRAREL